MFKNSERNVTMEKGHELAEKSTCNGYSVCIGSLNHELAACSTCEMMGGRGYPVFKSPVSELFEHIETFGGGFIEMLTLSDFLEYPGFNDCSASNHGSVGAGLLDCIVKVEVREDVSVSDIRQLRWRECTRRKPFLELFHIRGSGNLSL